MAYTKYRSITVDHTKCGSADSANFPMLFAGTYTYLKTVANGGSLTDANGYDVIFSSSTSDADKLSFEIEYHDVATGVIVAWVKIPTLTFASDAVIYLLYNNSSISTYQGNNTGTWNSNFKRVYHLPNGTTLTANDSTSSGANGNLINTPTASTGKIDGSGNFVRASSQHITASGTGLPTTGVNSVAAWIKTTDSNSSFIYNWGSGGTSIYLGFSSGGDGKAYYGDASTLIKSAGAINDGNWHHLVATYNGSNSRKIYVDGALSNSDAGSLTGAAANAAISANQNSTATFNVQGDIDEVEVFDLELTADWITSTYNSQNNPSTFYTVGSEVSTASAIPVFIHHYRQQGIM